MLLAVCSKQKLEETVSFLKNSGYEVCGFPILDTIPVPHILPKNIQAIFLTSSAPVNLIQHNNLPTYTIGESTARAAKSAGFSVVYTGTGSAENMAQDLKKLSLPKNCWHPTSAFGKEKWYTKLPQINIHREIVYLIKPNKKITETLLNKFKNNEITSILLMSAIGARTFAQLIIEHNINVSSIRLIAFSTAVMAEIKNFPFAQKTTLPKPNLASISQIKMT